MSMIASALAAAGEANTSTLQTVELCRLTLQENGSNHLIGHVTVRQDSNNVSASFLLHCAASRGTGNAMISGQSAVSSLVPLGFVLASCSFGVDNGDVVLYAHGALLTALHWAGGIDVVGEYE